MAQPAPCALGLALLPRGMAYDSKLVRDMAYAVGLLSPPLLVLDASGGGAEEWWNSCTSRSESWLRELDLSPQPLEYFLSVMVGAGLGRVANYHAALVQFWLMHAPSLGETVLSDGPSSVQRHTIWGLQVGGRRLTADLKLLAAMLDSDPIGGQPGAAALHVEPHIVFAIDASSLLVDEVAPADPPKLAKGSQGPPLGCLVSFDLDSNVQYKMQVMLHKLAIAGSPQLQVWAKEHFQRESIASIGRLSGGVFRPLTPDGHFPSVLDGEELAQKLFWTEDVVALVAVRPHSRWAVCDWRHLLAPARIIAVDRGKLHFSRGIDGQPCVVPLAPTPPQVPVMPLPPLSPSARSDEVQQLQFLLIQAGFLRPSAIRFHSGIFGKHTGARGKSFADLPLPAYGALSTLSRWVLRGTGTGCLRNRGCPDCAASS